MPDEDFVVVEGDADALEEEEEEVRVEVMRVEGTAVEDPEPPPTTAPRT